MYFCHKTVNLKVILNFIGVKMTMNGDYYSIVGVILPVENKIYIKFFQIKQYFMLNKDDLIISSKQISNNSLIGVASTENITDNMLALNG